MLTGRGTDSRLDQVDRVSAVDRKAAKKARRAGLGAEGQWLGEEEEDGR
jgi:GTPase